MKGIIYDLKFKLPNRTYVESNDLSMRDLLNTISNNFKDYYDINFTLTNQTVYNLITRPAKASKLVKEFCIIKKKHGSPTPRININDNNNNIDNSDISSETTGITDRVYNILEDLYGTDNESDGSYLDNLNDSDIEAL